MTSFVARHGAISVMVSMAFGIRLVADGGRVLLVATTPVGVFR